jgi:hypothetical protein
VDAFGQSEVGQFVFGAVLGPLVFGQLVLGILGYDSGVCGHMVVPVPT